MTAASIGTYPLGGTIRYYINQAGCAGIPDDSEFVAVQRGFQEWEDDLGSYVDFTYMGTTNLGASLFSGSEDGANFVQWVNAGATGWSAATYSPLTGNPLREQDIVFNDFYVWSTTGATNAFDVQNIATHEAGHFLRLLDLTGVGDADRRCIFPQHLGKRINGH